MKVYDFDKTIYTGDSTIDFYLFCLRKYPGIIFRFPRQLWGFVCYFLGRITKTRLKESFFVFLNDIPQIHQTVEEFWDRNQHKMKRWYLQQQEKDDLVISASPEFLLREICSRLHIENMIASDVDKHTGKFFSENCYGKEKVSRFREKYPNMEIEIFYSDSESDAPLAFMAKKAYIVRGESLYVWKREGKNEE